MTITRGVGMRGGHLSTTGLSPGGAVVSVPTHEHEVELDFVRYEARVGYALSPRWQAELRVPYDVKTRRADVVLVDPATADEVAAMQANLNIHHPSETLRGLADPTLVVLHVTRDVFRAGDVVTAGLGTSLPLGRIEDDPYELGDAGLAHEHVQFGTGTFDPLAEVHYAVPLGERWAAAGDLTARVPLYANRKGYRGPPELSASLTATVAPHERWRLRAGWSFFYQDYAEWDGARDINSGLVSHGALAGIGWRVSDATTLRLDARIPLSQRNLADGGDSFDLGTVVQLGLSYAL